MHYQVLFSWCPPLSHHIVGYPNPLENTPRLSLLLKGIQRTKPLRAKPRLPVTPHILLAARSSLNVQSSADDRMLWAACLLGFFGFLRSAEFTTPSAAQFNSLIHLTAADIAVDNRSNPSMLSVHIKQSKTDQFGQGFTLYLGRTDNALCPVTAILNYLAHRSSDNGPLFCLQDGRPLSRQTLVGLLCQALTKARSMQAITMVTHLG